MSDIQFIDPIESTDTCEWRCRRCGDYIISRKRPKCENCDGAPPAPAGSFWNEPEFRLLLSGLLSHVDWRGGGRDIIPLQPHEKVNR